MDHQPPPVSDDSAITPERTGSTISRAKRSERSREAILDAAVTLFAERGYHGVSLADITAACGAKRALILYYFKSKSELWQAAALKAARLFNDKVQEKLGSAEGADGSEHRVRVIGAWLDAFVEQSDFPKMLVFEGNMPGPRLDWLVQHFHRDPVTFGDEIYREQLNNTVLRDALMAIFLSMSALGPLMEASYARVSGKSDAGLYPLSRQRRDELVDLIIGFADIYEKAR